MSLIGIAKTGAGQVACEEIREAASVAAAITAFCAVPPLNEADYVGVDTGWASVPQHAKGKKHGIDRDANPMVMVEVAYVPPTKLKASSTLGVGEVAVTTAAPSWQVISGVVTNPSVLIGDLGDAIGRATGGVKCSGGPVEIMVTEDDGTNPEKDLLSAPYSHADTAGAWDTFGCNTDVVPAAGRCTYRLKARLPAGTASASVRYCGLALLEKD